MGQRALTLIVAVSAAGLGLAGGGCAPRALYAFDLTPHPDMPGPEDLVLDGPDRLLISSQERRTEPWPPGAVFALHMPTGEVTELPRVGEPEGFTLHPHGLDRVRGEDGQVRLYVVNHRPEGGEPHHTIAVYRVREDRLDFVELLESPLLTSPNDLAARPDGQIYVSNDRSAQGGLCEMILALPRTTVVHYDGDGSWKVVADGLAMANGIAVVGHKVVVAATRENAIYGYWILGDGSLVHRHRLAKVPGPDNFFVAGNDLFVAGHPRPFAFAAHALNPEKRSPSQVHRLDLGNKELQLIFADDGSGISAASTAIWLDQTLWIGQVFEPSVVEAHVAGGAP